MMDDIELKSKIYLDDCFNDPKYLSSKSNTSDACILLNDYFKIQSYRAATSGRSVDIYYNEELVFPLGANLNEYFFTSLATFIKNRILFHKLELLG